MQTPRRAKVRCHSAPLTDHTNVDGFENPRLYELLTGRAVALCCAHPRHLRRPDSAAGTSLVAHGHAFPVFSLRLFSWSRAEGSRKHPSSQEAWDARVRGGAG